MHSNFLPSILKQSSDVSCWFRKVRAKPFSSHRAFRSPGFSCSDRKGSAKPQLGPKLCCTHIRLDWKMHCKCSKLFKPKNEAHLHLGSTPWSTSSRLGGPLYCFSSSNVSYWRQLSWSSPAVHQRGGTKQETAWLYLAPDPDKGWKLSDPRATLWDARSVKRLTLTGTVPDISWATQASPGTSEEIST